MNRSAHVPSTSIVTFTITIDNLCASGHLPTLASVQLYTCMLIVRSGLLIVSVHSEPTTLPHTPSPSIVSVKADVLQHAT